METQREVQTLKAPSGKEVIIKAYMTGRESRAVRFATIKAGVDVSAITEQNYFAVEDSMIAQAVVSYDGSAEKIAERLQDANSDDYGFVVGEVTKLILKKNQPVTTSDMNSSGTTESDTPA